MPGKPFTKKGWRMYETLKKTKGVESAVKITSATPGTRLKAKKKKKAKK